MFVAKFTKTSDEKFTADKNGNYPFIGTIVAGIAKGSIINGTLFQREGLETNQLYLCENSIDEKYPDNVQTTVVAKVSVLEFMALRSELGAGKIIQANVAAEAPVAEEVAAEA